MTAHFTEETTGYWQRLVAADALPQAEAPWRYGYPARLPDGRVLMLPIRQLASEPAHAVASLIVNQASLEVVDTLAAMLADKLSAFAAEHVIGLPTLGLALAPGAARALGHTRYVPLGYSRKFWYEETHSVPVVSITTPGPGKRVYLDPNLRSLVEGRRLVLVDDAISSGSTLDAAWGLIESLGGEVAGCGVAMIQGRRWVEKLGAQRAGRVVGVFESPLLKAVPDGWVPRD
jgi:adenine/guanine phosphoribosyltransferase-like PRPP-binding protein